MPRWIGPFLGGVADDDHRRALLRDASGHLVLVDLAGGGRPWRSAEPLWPLALDADRAYALRFGPPEVVALEAAGGAERWRSAPLDWPAWAAGAAEAAGLGGASDLHVAWWGDAQLLLAWRLRRPAGAAQRRPAAASPHGACRIACTDGTVEPLEPGTADDLLAQAAAWSDDEAGAAAGSDDPAVLAQRTVRGVRYALAHRPAGDGAPGRMQRVVEADPVPGARDPEPSAASATGPGRWQCVLDTEPAPRQPARRPPPR